VHVAAVVVGAIVGVGIFFTPATLAKTMPSPSWMLGIWLLGGIVSAAGALVFAELGGRYPHAGGIYVFLREGFGPRAGPPIAFLYGWQQLLVVQPGSMAIIAVVLIDHVALLTGALSAPARSMGAIAAIALFTAANLIGLRAGGRVQVIISSLKIGALLLVVLVGLGWGDPARVMAAPANVAEGGPVNWLLIGLIPVLFSFAGWQHGTYIAGSVRDPERAVPGGIMLGVAVVLVAYLGVNVAYLGLLGHDGLAASSSPAADAIGVALGPLAAKVLAMAIVLSAAGILNTVCLGFPFVVYAMAKDGVFFAAAGKLDERTGRPALAVTLQGALSCAAVLLGASRIDVLLTGIVFADLSFQAATAVVHLRVHNRAADERILRAPAFMSWTFLLITAAIALGSLWKRPLESAYGAIVLVVGIGVWWWWRRR